MTFASPLRLLCAAALSTALLTSALPSFAAEQPAPAPVAPSAPATAVPGETPPAEKPAEQPAAPAAPAEQPAEPAAPPAPAEQPAAPTPTPTPTATKAPDNKVTSEVPSPDWNPLLDPKSNARYGEHFAEPVTPMKLAQPGESFGTAAFGPRTGEFAVTLVTVQLADKTVADTDAISMFHARDSIAKSSEYWQRVSNYRLSMTRVNEFRHKSAAKHTDSYERIMAIVTNELAQQGKWVTGSYKSLVIFVPHKDLNYNGQWGILGGGFTDSDTSGRVIMPYPSALTNNVVTHEFGHVLGLHHANSLACGNGRTDVPRDSSGWADSACWSYEYGDTTDLMGFAQPSSPQIGAFLWEYGGFGGGGEILNAGVATGMKQYTLRPWAGSAGNRAVKFTDPVSKEVYYLELRLPVGYDAATAVGGNRGVKITKKDVIGWSGNASIVLTPNSYNYGWGNSNLTWQAGQTFTTHSGTKVRIDSITADSAQITIDAYASSASVAKPLVDAAAGKASLGAATTALICGITDGGCYQNFQNGQVHWSPSSGAHATKGAINLIWGQAGWERGRVGYPTSDEICGLAGGGCLQTFQRGNIYWSPATGPAFTLGALDSTWGSLGRERSRLGYPKGNEVCGITDGGCYQNFQGGQIHWSVRSGAWATWDAIGRAWGQAGWEKGVLGYPISNETCGLVNEGCYQNFQGGSIHRSSTTGAYATRGALGDAWAASGWEGGRLGYPTGNQICGLKDNGCLQTFQRGNLYTSASTGTAATTGAIDSAWGALGREQGKLGYPTGNETCGLAGGGCYQNFQGGAIHWSPATGAYPTWGLTGRAWAASGWETGTLGYPTSNETCGLAAGGCYQNFQNGQIHWAPGVGAFATRGVLASAWSATGWENGKLGYPTGNQACGLKDGGCYQNFQNGQIHWSPATGAHPTTGAIATAWGGTGWENGTLGYPTTNETCTSTGTCTQRFQKGTLTWSPTRGITRT